MHHCVHQPHSRLEGADSKRYRFRFFQWAQSSALKPSRLIALTVSLLLHLLGLTSVIARQHAVSSSSSTSTQEFAGREYCVFPEEICTTGNCSPAMRAGLFDTSDMKTMVGEAYVWRQETMMYLTVKAKAPYLIPTQAADHMRMYMGAHLPKNSQAQFVDTLRVINRPVPCATITLNLEIVCLPGCMYQPATDECQCPSTLHHGGTPRTSPQDAAQEVDINTVDLLNRASIYMSLNLKLVPARRNYGHPNSLVPVSATMHTIQWGSIRESQCGGGDCTCMPTLQLHSWGAILEWRNPDAEAPVPRLIAEFHQRQGHLHRHVPHYKVVPGVTAHGIVRQGVRQFLLDTMPNDHSVRNALFAPFGSYRDDEDDDQF